MHEPSNALTFPARAEICAHLHVQMTRRAFARADDTPRSIALTTLTGVLRREEERSLIACEQ